MLVKSGRDPGTGPKVAICVSTVCRYVWHVCVVLLCVEPRSGLSWRGAAVTVAMKGPGTGKHRMHEDGAELG